MLWSLLKFVIFIGLVAAAAWGALFLTETDGGVRIAVGGTEFTLNALQSVIALLVLIVAAWVLFKIISLVVAFLRFAAGDKTSIDRFFDRRRERKGFDAMADGMLALASGEGKLAIAKANKAEKLLKRPELTTLLTAQAAEQVGDTKQAEIAYKRLLKDERTRFVGVRGLMKQQLAAGNTDTALKLADKAFSLRPGHTETQDVLLKLQASAHDWSGARKTLGAKLKHGSLPRDVHNRRDAVLALGEAHDILDDNSPIEAREKAIEANRRSPDLIPAAVMAADGYTAQNKARNATRILKKAWSVQPHPDLAAAFARIKPDETSVARIKRFGVLTSQHSDHPETQMLRAELFIAGEDYPAARKAIGDLAETDPTARVLTIMAAVERGTGSDDAVVRGWLARALSAPRGPQWVCNHCDRPHGAWTPVCESCGSFDTLSWTRPKDGAAALPAGAEMLPLIVGQIEGPLDPEPTDGSDIKENPKVEEPDVDIEETSDLENEVTDTDADDEKANMKIANEDEPPLDFVLEKDAK
ncbi:heme biosynthesis protein HemY [Rhodobacteraceae bacterium]|nr:heme biosynthesis protein HemY [Paracoccaceae bacterium]